MSKDKFDQLEKFIAYIENSDFDFFDTIFGSTVIDRMNPNKLYNHYYNKFTVECDSNGQSFFCALDIDNQRLLYFTYIRDMNINIFMFDFPLFTRLGYSNEVDDMLRKLYSYFPFYTLDEIRNGLCNDYINKKIYRNLMDLYRSLNDDEKNIFINIYNKYCLK